jgi:hypothetical protein
MIELLRALAVFAEQSQVGHRPLADALGIPSPTPAEHADLFLFQLYPYASVHLGPEGQLGGIARDRVAGLMRAIGAAPSPEPDHVSTLLGVYAALLEAHDRSANIEGQREAPTPVERVRRALLVEHIVAWVPAYLQRVMDLGGPSHHRWATLLDDILRHEADRTSEVVGLLPVHLETAPHLPDPRRSPPHEFWDGLLAPVRTGLILTSSDLARAAADLGLVLRVGERRFVLRCLLEQDAPALLMWLASAAQNSSQKWESHWLAGTPTGDWWRERAGATHHLLVELAADSCRSRSEMAT